MDSSVESSALERLVSEVKNEINVNGCRVSPSAYDTAWLAMIPDDGKENENGPMFGACLEWILENQKEGGFWGETDDQDLPTIDALTATLACAIALNLWNAGRRNIQSGLSFIHSKAESLVKVNYQKLPRWFVLTFPAMIEMAEAAGLRLCFPPGLIGVIAHIFITRHHILQTEELVQAEESSRYFPPLLSYLETLPSTYEFLDRQETVNRYLSSDGSLFQSPSATAQAFISTGNIHSLNYLRSLLVNFPNGGVPAKYPVDRDLIKLCMVDHVQGLGLGSHFNQEIEQILAQLHSKCNQKIIEEASNADTISMKLFKDSLGFRLLRMHRHYVHPESFCWFLREPETVSYMEENSEEFISAMYNVYRATDLAFPGETQMEEARNFARKFIENPSYTQRDHNLLITKGLQNLMKYEVDVPWRARLDRLYHREWIEENKSSPLWIGKASYYRFPCLENKKLMQLAVEKFEFEQSIYVRELEELGGWSKKWRLSEMGFGREKTMYCYFSVASACSGFAYNSIMRLVLAKAAIIVTVADDFYDMEGSMAELEILTDAVKRWDGEGLDGHSKTIFEALDDYVNDIVAKCYPQQGTRVLPMLQHLWRECFTSWMVERRWSESGHIPSMDEYLETGMASVAVHAIVLPATTFFFNGTAAAAAPCQYQTITKLLMLIARLANDLQSYQKEMADGKMNLVVLHKGKSSIEESVARVKQILEEKRKEFLQRVFRDDEEMPESCKQIHLHCMKVFEMFYNSANLFDSETALLQDIQKSLYLPIHRKPKSKPEHPIISLPNSNNYKMTTTNDKSKVSARFSTPPFTNYLPGKLQLLPNPMRCNLRFIALPL